MKKFITQERAQLIYHQALEALQQLGIEFTDESYAHRITQEVPCTWRNGRFYFDSAQIDAFFTMRQPRLPGRTNSKNSETITIGGGWNSWYLCDPTENMPRRATRAEAIQMAKLAESLGGHRGPIPVVPGDVDPKFHTLECEAIALCHTRGMGGCLTATKSGEIELLKRMYEVAGRRYLLALEPLISPMRINPEVMEVYFRWRDDPDLDITIFTPIPMVGATAPVAFPAALVQVLAEALAQDYLFYHLSGGKQTDGFNLRLDPFDMKQGNIAFGSPEWCLCKQALTELWQELLGGDGTYGSFRTNSRRVDAQCMLERTASFVYQLEIGIRHFSAVGQLAVDEVFSPVQAVLDAELAQYGQRLLRGLDDIWTQEEDTMDILCEGVQTHSFLYADSTLGLFREMYDLGRLSDTSNVDTWKRAGEPCFEQRAWKRAQDIIEEHTFALEPARAREVLRLLEGYKTKNQ